MRDHNYDSTMDDSDAVSMSTTHYRLDEDDTGEPKGHQVIIDPAGQNGFEIDDAFVPTIKVKDDTLEIKPRAYQIEMLEESLKHNIIVAVSLLDAVWLTGMRLKLAG